VADDLATLALDMLMAERDYLRSGPTCCSSRARSATQTETWQVLPVAETMQPPNAADQDPETTARDRNLRPPSVDVSSRTKRCNP